MRKTLLFPLVFCFTLLTACGGTGSEMPRQTSPKCISWHQECATRFFCLNVCDEFESSSSPSSR